MGFIGQPLNAGNLSVDVFTGNGSTTVFALTYSVGSSESLAIYLDGVKQAVSTYVASGTVLTFTTAPPNLVGIEVVFLALSISLPTPGDNTVGLAQLAGGTDGELITWDASGNPAVVAVGTAGHVLTSGGVGVAPTMQAPADPVWVLLQESDSGTAGTVTVGSAALLSSTYKTYKIIGTGVACQTDNVQGRVRVSIATTIQTGVNYEWAGYYIDSNVASLLPKVDAGEAFFERWIGVSKGNAAGEVGNFEMTIYNPAATDNIKCFSMSSGTLTMTPTMVIYKAEGFFNSGTAAIDGIQFYFSSGDFAAGNFKLYGLK